MSWIKDLFWIVAVTLCLLVLVNVLLVYFSPIIAPHVGHKIIESLDPCYRSLYQDDVSSFSSAGKSVLVVGDSHAEGIGDEFLSNTPDYGFIKKLDKTDEAYLIAGKSGYGNISEYNDIENCLSLLSRITYIDFDKEKVDEIIFIFYEGNDLLDNLHGIGVVEIGKGLSWKRTKRVFMPLYYLFRSMRQEFFGQHEEHQPEHVGVPFDVENVSVTGLTIPPNIESAPVGLTQDELMLTLEITKDIVNRLSSDFPNAEVRILYLPATATVYEIEGDLISEWVDETTHIKTTSKLNMERSETVRAAIRDHCNANGVCQFCDATPVMREVASGGAALHGPRDWGHPNGLGYTAMRDAYVRCFGSLEN